MSATLTHTATDWGVNNCSQWHAAWGAGQELAGTRGVKSSAG
jgi:hypothetical protein